MKLLGEFVFFLVLVAVSTVESDSDSKDVRKVGPNMLHNPRDQNKTISNVRTFLNSANISEIISDYIDASVPESAPLLTLRNSDANKTVYVLQKMPDLNQIIVNDIQKDLLLNIKTVLVKVNKSTISAADVVVNKTLIYSGTSAPSFIVKSKVVKRNKGYFRDVSTNVLPSPRRSIVGEGPVESPCRSFVSGDPVQKALYSPGYPGMYPNRSNCVRILEAPPEFKIRLNFTDVFDLRISEGCQSDFLEIRDGASGFSRTVGRYCGREKPLMVVSTGRWLWLRFHSDGNSGHSGFTAFYEFVQRLVSVAVLANSDDRDGRKFQPKNVDDTTNQKNIADTSGGETPANSANISDNSVSNSVNNSVNSAAISNNRNQENSDNKSTNLDSRTDLLYNSIHNKSNKITVIPTTESMTELGYNNDVVTLPNVLLNNSEFTSKNISVVVSQNGEDTPFVTFVNVDFEERIISPDSLSSRRQSPKRRDVQDGVAGPCRSFVEGEPENQVLYSPGYPDNYPNHSDCVRVLEAPPGFLLRLDFRDNFDLEPSEDCKFDYLEIRDGAHGFSNLIGKYCGKEFPPMVTSRERNLWLHFHSDENIEYSGFKAVYEYIPRPTSPHYQPEQELCRLEVSGYEGFLNRSDIPAERTEMAVKHGSALDCMWVITVAEGWKIYLHFLEFKLEKPNDCVSNFVDIFTENTDLPSRLKNFCGSIADSVTSSKNILHVRFLAEAHAINSTFVALYTAIRDKGGQPTCADDEYDCEDATCISGSLRCNGRINCRFRWDEDECPEESSGLNIQSHHIIYIMVIFMLILTGMCTAFLVNCIKKLIRDHRIIREHIRQSRDNRLDEVGEKTGKMREDDSSSQKQTKRRSPHPDVSRSQNTLAVNSANCFMPTDTLIPIIQKSSNTNGDVFIRDNRSNELLRKRNDTDSNLQQQGTESNDINYDSDELMGSGQIPEMCDSACQTRESLFQVGFNTSSERSSSPHVHVLPSGVRTLDRGVQSPRFSTFGYDDSRGRLDRNDTLPKQSDRYKAEAVIEMDQFRDKSRSKTCTNYDSKRSVNDSTPPGGCDVHYHQKQQQQGGTPHAFSKSPQNYRVHHEPDSKIRQFDNDKTLIDNRGYSVETTKSAPDVIIMTSH